MRRINRRKCASISTFLAAASIAGWIGTSPARGDFLVQMTNPEAGDPLQNNPDTANLASAYTGPVQDFVLSAENNGLNNTGDELTAVGITITVAGSGSQSALIFDVNQPGANSKYVVNTTGQSDPGTVGFGDPNGGTYLGIGASAIPTGYDPNPNNANPSDGIGVDGANQSEADTFGGSSEIVPFTPPNSSVLSSNKNSPAGIDPNFLNGVVHGFEATSAIPGGGVPDGPADGYVPFANIVVPQGVSGSAYVFVGGNNGPAEVFTFNFNGNPAGAKLGMTSDVISTSNLVGSAQQGNGPLTLSVPAGVDQTNGSYSLVLGETGTEQVVGLAGTGLSGLASVFDAGLTPDAGDVVPVTVANLGQSLYDLLNSEGDQLAVVFYDPASPGQNEAFSWDTGNTTATISSITVVAATGVPLPEPAGLTALVLGGVSVMSRRRVGRRG